MRVLVEEVPVHRDARGEVFEPLAPDTLRSQRNVHIVLTEPGGIRGNHFHRRGTEVMTVYGPALVRHGVGADVESTRVAEGQALRFTFPPGVAHAVQNVGDKPNVLIVFNTQAHDSVDPDVFRHTLIEPSA